MAVVVLAVACALALGLLAGGRFTALGELPLRSAWLVVAAVGVQVAGALLPLRAAYAEGLVLSALLAAAFLARNRRLPGTGLIALGLAANALAVLVNHGVMPVDLTALARVGGGSGDLLQDPRHAPGSSRDRLRLLTDVVPAPLPLGLGQVLSPGDVLVASGAALLVFSGVRGAGAAPGAWQDGGMAKKGRKRRSRKGSKANHGKRPNA